MNGGILRAPVPTPLPTLVTSPSPTPVDDPQPLSFPRDDGPHHRLTEWWYYTGHFQVADGRALSGQPSTAVGRDFGFEFVVFRAERGDFPVAWASHFAVTDSTAGLFTYDQRTEVGPQVDRSPVGGGFDLSLAPPVAPGPSTPAPGPSTPAPGSVSSPEPWRMSGANGKDVLRAVGAPGGIFLDLSSDRPPVLHGGSAWIDLGPAGGTYYYSRTGMSVVGKYQAAPDDPLQPVSGLAWFDHQWGDFIAVGGGGWDWYSVQLGDGRDLMISLVRAPGGAEAFRYGTLVSADGSARHLVAGEIEISVLNHWLSPHSGATYPSEWQVTLPAEGLELHLTPTLADQELDTTASTGVIYWEGEVRVDGSDHGRPLSGLGYVELTGYAK